jgi:hypothetical protein
LIGEDESQERSWREQARVIFLLPVDTGIGRSEVGGLIVPLGRAR